jgi:DNA-binding response OmpR family regulator
MSGLRVLIAEDDPSIRDLLVHHLDRDGFHSVQTGNGQAALRIARDGVDLVILDVGLPGMDGFDILRTLRRERRSVPVLLLTARCEEVDRVIGFEVGADDYVVKPFSPREIVARVRAILRRAGTPADTSPRVIRCGRLEIDEAARVARIDGSEIGLKPREFALLFALASNPGVAISRSTLLERVWGFDFEGDARTVDVHIRRLRMKLEENAQLSPLFVTVHGFGYKFTAD